MRILVVWSSTRIIVCIMVLSIRGIFSKERPNGMAHATSWCRSAAAELTTSRGGFREASPKRSVGDQPPRVPVLVLGASAGRRYESPRLFLNYGTFLANRACVERQSRCLSLVLFQGSDWSRCWAAMLAYQPISLPQLSFIFSTKNFITTIRHYYIPNIRSRFVG